MANTISNTDTVIDSRDVIARIEELTAERDGLVAAIDDAVSEEQGSGDIEALKLALAEWLDGEDGLELASLEKLAEEAEGYAPDWTCGATLIRDDYFERAMDELVEDIGDMPKDIPSYMTIVLDYTALQQDYSAVDFDGETYWVR